MATARLNRAMTHVRPRLMPALCVFAISGCISQAWSNTGPPLPNADDRPTPLHFGLYVTPDPAQNPIDPPERFTGYHAAIDVEILPGEEEADVPVFAICRGLIDFSGQVEGYGGFIRQHCSIDGQDVSVLYGHLKVASLIPRGRIAGAGQQLGVLGRARSGDTDGTRKHLHLGIAKGHTSEARGYVTEPEELEGFLNPEEVLGL